jgi:Tol biopolymer transport system component
MNYNRPCEARHGFVRLAAIVLPLLIVLGCSSAQSGHAPGVAGGETLTPGVTNYPLAYIKQPVPTTDIDVRDLITSITGSDLYVRAQASAGGMETNVTQSITKGMGAVRDLDVSPDGTKIVFSLRLPLDPNKKNTDPTQPTWQIYQYDATTNAVTQLTTDDITSGHDVGAHYLPDGRIVFASTRQLATQSILLDEGRPQYQAVTDNRQQFIFLLHVMNGDGTGMHQISFNTNHDFAPSVLANGQIVFSRWEVTNGTDQISLYRANPDGTALELYYGANSHATGANVAGTNDNVIQFLNARQRADGKLIAIDRPFLGTQLGGDTLLIDAANFVEFDQASTPTPGTSGSGQTSATALGVTTDANKPSLGGRFASVYPLYDGTNRMLVSWAPCLILNADGSTAVCNNANTTGANVQQAPPPYTIWIYDFDAGTLSPVISSVPGIEIVEPVILQARTPPPAFIPDAVPTSTAGQTLVTNQVGILDISSVYDFGGVDTANPNIVQVSDPAQAAFYERPARFIRIEKAVEIPDKTVRKINDSAFGPAGMGMREILGYAPIQPDGSVQIQVPANVPFTIDILDANARRITAQHTSWLQLIPGETKSCNGCHSTANNTSHGRSGLTVAVNQGAPTTGQPFPDTNPALFANAGETMAQTLARVSCASGSALPCSQILSTDVTYATTWTTGVTLPATLPADSPISYTYSGTAGLSETPPINANCVPWSAQCRVTIHYANAASPNQLYIQSVWDLSTRTATVQGVANSPATCVTCHNTVNAMNTIQVPTGQLDLTGGASSVDITVVTSYESLLFPHDEQALNMGVLQPVLIGGAAVTLPPPMTAGSAIGSTAFLQMFDGSFHDPVLDHTGFLTPAELRLISEWLDIGGQFYNDPFVAPVAN